MSKHFIAPAVLAPLGYRKNGLPIFPIMGGDGTDDKRTAPTLTHSQSVNRLKEITTELERLGELDELTPEDEQYFGELRSEFDQLDKHRKRLERDAQLAEVRNASKGIGGFRVERGSAASSNDYDRDAILEPDSVEDKRFRNPWDLSEVRTFGRDKDDLAQEYRARAESAIERMQGCNDSIREAAQQMLQRADDQAAFSRQVLATSSPAYMRAWAKCVRGEAQTMNADEQRAMSLTTTAGGYLLPFQLDPSVIITSDGSKNDIRRAARQVVATSNKWNGVSAGEVSFSWDGEAAQVSDDTPTFAQPSVTVHKLQGFVPISIEALEDEQNVTQEVGRLLASGKDTAEAVAFATGAGDGSNQPFGIVTALAGGSYEVAPQTAETFAIGDIYALDSALPARYRGNASWLAHRTIYNLIRQFDTNGGAGLWERIGNGQPPELMGRPALEAEAMDSSWNVAASADNYILVYGDLKNYVIADRVGTRVELVSHLFGANQRPTGQRGWYCYYRVGADSVNDAGMRLLNLETTA